MDLDEIPRGIVRDDDLLEIFLTEFDIRMTEADVEAVADDYGLNTNYRPPNGVPDEQVFISFSEQNLYDYQDNLGGLNLPYQVIVLVLNPEGSEDYLKDMIYEEIHFHDYGRIFQSSFTDDGIQDTFQELMRGILDNTTGLRVLLDASETEGEIAFTYDAEEGAEADMLLVLYPKDEVHVAFALIHPESRYIPG